MDLFKLAVDKGILVHSSAQISLVDELSVTEEQCIASMTEGAGPELFNSENKPTIMRISAWMVHEGVNGNRQGFIKEELEVAASGLFSKPNFGVVDFNHSSVRMFSEDPKMIGIWYSAEFAFDEKENKWGILASGVIYSWLFPEIADILLATQQRLGNVPVSMMAWPGSLENGSDENGFFEIIHNPIFFAVSVLDVPPADHGALGKVTEDHEIADKELTKQLLEASHKYEAAALLQFKIRCKTNLGQLKAASCQIDHEGDSMDKDIIELTAKNAEHRERIAEMTAAFSVNEVALEKAQEVIVEHEATIAEHVIRIEEVETARDAANTERDDALTDLDTFKTEVEGLRTKVEEFETVTAERESKERLASRLDKLPEAFQKFHGAKADETRTRLETKWANMEDEEWDEYVKDELLGYDVKVSFQDRSALEGFLPAGNADEDKTIKARVARVLSK